VADKSRSGNSGNGTLTKSGIRRRGADPPKNDSVISSFAASSRDVSCGNGSNDTSKPLRCGVPLLRAKLHTHNRYGRVYQ